MNRAKGLIANAKKKKKNGYKIFCLVVVKCYVKIAVEKKKKTNNNSIIPLVENGSTES